MGNAVDRARAVQAETEALKVSAQETTACAAGNDRRAQEPEGGAEVASASHQAPAGARRRVSYPVSDSVCCKRRSNEPPRLVGRAHASTGVSR